MYIYIHECIYECRYECMNNCNNYEYFYVWNVWIIKWKYTLYKSILHPSHDVDDYNHFYFVLSVVFIMHQHHQHHRDYPVLHHFQLARCNTKHKYMLAWMTWPVKCLFLAALFNKVMNCFICKLITTTTKTKKCIIISFCCLQND